MICHGWLRRALSKRAGRYKIANPQKEDGHIDLANEIVEALAKIRISGEEMQCLWVIFRKTYGWHKKEDSISLSQFCEFTTLKKPNVCHVLSKLLSKNIISIVKKDNGISSYGFNKDFDTWKPLPKKITLLKNIKGGVKKDNESLSILTHTKETIQKKTIQKKYILPDVKLFIDFYHTIFKEKFGSSPMIQGAKDGSIVKRLLKQNPLEELKILLLRMFDSDDSFILGSGYTIGVFQSQINKLKIGQKSGFQGERLWLKMQEEKDEKERQEKISHGLIENKSIPTRSDPES